LLILDVIDDICPYFAELDAIYSKSVGFSPPHKRQSGAVSPPAITSSPLRDLHAYFPNPPPSCSPATQDRQTINVDTPEADATQDYPWPASSPPDSPFASPNLRPPAPTANIPPPSPQKRPPRKIKSSQRSSAAPASTSTPLNFSKYAGKRPADNDAEDDEDMPTAKIPRKSAKAREADFADTLADANAQRHTETMEKLKVEAQKSADRDKMNAREIALKETEAALKAKQLEMDHIRDMRRIELDNKKEEQATARDAAMWAFLSNFAPK
jgi:hypothetical protein